MALLSGLLSDVTSTLGTPSASVGVGVDVTHDVSASVAGISVSSTGAVAETVGAGVDTSGLLGSSGGLVSGLLGSGGGLLGGIL